MSKVEGRIMKTGIERIATERLRQVTEEGWDTEHDAGHSLGALSQAAACYSELASAQAAGTRAKKDRIADILSGKCSLCWPFEEDCFKPSVDPIRNLEKAGALIAAEIDRLLIQHYGSLEVTES